MKRIVIAGVAVTFVLVIAAVAFLNFGWGSVPKYVPGTPAKMVPGEFTGCNLVGDLPFQNGRVWIWSSDTNFTHHATYLYDLNQRVILGHLFHTTLPFLQNRDGSRILVIGPQTAAPPKLLLPALLRIDKIFGTRILNKTLPADTLWILDTLNNSVKRVLVGGPVYGPWRPSPDFRYGYADFVRLQYLCDLENERITPVTVSGQPCGWWDDEDILIHDYSGNLLLFNVGTGQTRKIFADTFLAQQGGTNWVMRPLANWNGHEYDFYFNFYYETRMTAGSGKGNSVLLKIDRASRSLKLLYPHFKFENDGVLDAAGTQYLFSGESAPGSGGDGSVYLRDLATGKTTLLVPPDKRGHYAYPRFFGDEVIYSRNVQLRRIKLDGTGDQPVLQEPK